ncbi:unnamed protein product [Acanthoscelides obtectus]|uniref:Reverse transcriptase domain-containing protein n=1 Tax=Acanthoscelides obtectus TaxID=200917 RepID=A0A9P0PQA6_ACAOB|nr:unnamed protein product [Acanthoscelides obtectus]CAK1640479.1 hypothetical protein AOBTE_LOCUS11749 [Acanthoscelides obtectus]
MSTTAAINSFTEIINESFENKLYMKTDFFDLTKALDCVQHEILLSKLTPP